MPTSSDRSGHFAQGAASARESGGLPEGVEDAVIVRRTSRPAQKPTKSQVIKPGTVVPPRVYGA
jgi:hypothetical protein